MRKALVPLGLCLLLSGGAPADTDAAAGPETAPPMPGFAPEPAAAQRKLEGRFDAALSPGNLRDRMKRLSARPHHVGSPGGKENAEFLAAQLRSWGYETSIEEFTVLFPTPKTRLVEMVSPTRFRAALFEPPLKEDATSSLGKEQLPVYHAYSIDGDVTAPVVYVNYGVPTDYEELEKRGIDVKGKLVLARYGDSWRGIKPKVAAEHGAVGCIVYSDPHDDGFFQGDVYPKGAWRSEQGAQRGSVADMPLYPGDPLTPGVGATKEARRLAVKDAPTLTKIPVLPISWGDALPILRALAGPVAPESWRGAAPVTYHLGPGPATVHLQVVFDWRLVPAYDVIARLAGAEEPDTWIVRGNHHDAWVFGAADPVSGLVAMLEEARAVGELVKAGFRPRRTIVYAAWDGEEPGLLGSTEWAETHEEVLKKSAAVYVNTDGNGRGFLYMGGSPALEPFLNAVARDVVDPQTGISVQERVRSRILVNGKPDERKEARAKTDVPLDALGSGSDYTPFLQHLGIASLSIGFGGEDGGGSYHSIYDSFDHYTRFGDPDFAYGVALAKVGGRVVLRFAQADVLPFDFERLAETVSRYVGEVSKLADDARETTEEGNRNILEGRVGAAADPKEKTVVPKPRPSVPFLELAPLKNAASRLELSGKAYAEAARARERSATPLTPEAKKALEKILRGAEQVLTRSEGLPGRPWYRHQVYAPGFYTGYAVKTLPAVREAIEERRWDQANAQIPVVARTLEAFAAEVDRAAGLLR